MSFLLERPRGISRGKRRSYVAGLLASRSASWQISKRFQVWIQCKLLFVVFALHFYFAAVVVSPIFRFPQCVPVRVCHLIQFLIYLWSDRSLKISSLCFAVFNSIFIKAGLYFASSMQ